MPLIDYLALLALVTAMAFTSGPNTTLAAVLVATAVRMVNADRQGKQVFYALMDDHVRCVLNDMLHHLSEPHED